MVINKIIAKHPYALRDAVELDEYDATCLLLSVMFNSPYLYVLHLSHFTSIQNGSSCKAALEFSTCRFRPILIFAVFGRRLMPLHSFINLEVFNIIFPVLLPILCQNNTYFCRTRYMSHCNTLGLLQIERHVTGRQFDSSKAGGGDSRVVASRISKQEGPGSIPGGGKEV